MDSSFLHILIDAKTEYTQQLTTILSSPIYEGIISIYKHSKQTAHSKETILKNFQENLSKIPSWSEKTLEEEYTRIVLYSKCDWLIDLITAVFISHTKVLSSIHLGSKQRTIDLKIPTPTVFIHSIYINVAREFWKNPYLFYDENLNNIDIQRNMRDCEQIIKECIKNTIRKLLPVKHIIKEYLGEDCNDTILTEDITSQFSSDHYNKLKKMAKLDLDNINIENQETDYTNNITNEETQSIISIKSIAKNNKENSLSNDELEHSFKSYSPTNKDKETESENKNLEKVVPPKPIIKSSDLVSTLSTTSSVRRLKLLRTHDRPKKIVSSDILEDDNPSYF